ncbi:MAG: SAM-dependent methyltransferase, partial [Bacteroidetes bacterium]|nr:SAM-dependent methyltransferase [Bacteroidota bacterium]
HVIHAQPLRNFLGKTCNRILIFDPEEIWFEKTLQGAVIILAEKKTVSKKPADGLGIIKIKGDDFVTKHPQQYFLNANYLNGKTVEGKWTYALLTKDEFKLLGKLKENKCVHSFNDIANVDVGIVTGANKFFLVPNEIVEQYELQEFAHPMFGRSEHCPGIIYNDEQHRNNAKKRYPTNFLWFKVDSVENLTELQKEYILLGERNNLHRRYKCRVRSPWYTVPSVYATEIGMLTRSHDFPRLILNDINAYTTELAYRIKVEKLDSRLLVYSFINSLTALSAELEGRHYGGGVLELVPSEIEKLLVPIPQDVSIDLNMLNQKFYNKDKYILQNQDNVILTSIGLSEGEIGTLQYAWNRLKQRRQREKDVPSTQFQ